MTARNRPSAILIATVLLAGARPADAQTVDPSLRLPPGWNDAFFERLEEGLNPKTVVAVVNFSGGGLLESHLRFSMSDMLVTDLVQAGRFVVVERDRLDAVLQEQELQEGGFIDPSTAVEVGKILGAQLVVHGLVTKAAEQKIDKFAYDLVRVEVGVDIRAVETGTGRVVISQSAEGAAEAKVITTADGTIVSGPADYDPLYLDATVAALDSVSRLVSTAVPLIGFVIAVNGPDIMIDVGEGQGVKAGDTFIVFRKGDELKHPVTGNRIGWQKTVLAAIETVSTEQALATGRVTVVSDAAVQIAPGDLVMLRSLAPSRR